jgi:hypothetical protein
MGECGVNKVNGCARLLGDERAEFSVEVSLSASEDLNQKSESSRCPEHERHTRIELSRSNRFLLRVVTPLHEETPEYCQNHGLSVVFGTLHG